MPVLYDSGMASARDLLASEDLLTFQPQHFTADKDLVFVTPAEQEGDLYEIWEVRSDSPTARLRASAQPEQHARASAAKWTDESVRNFIAESMGPRTPAVKTKYVAVKVETVRTVS